MRFKVVPGDVPLAVAARRLGLTETEFARVLPRLYSRGFPFPDEDTGHFDIEAIDAWRRARHPHLFSMNVNLHASPEPTDNLVSHARIRERIAKMRDGPPA